MHFLGCNDTTRGVTIPLFCDTIRIATLGHDKIRIMNTKKNVLKSVSNVVNYRMLYRDFTYNKKQHIYTVSCCYCIPPSPEKRAMACYKLGFEEFIIMNKMFVQIFVLFNNFFNVLCCCVLCSRIHLYKLNSSKNKDTNRSSIMCKKLSQKF